VDSGLAVNSVVRSTERFAVGGDCCSIEGFGKNPAGEKMIEIFWIDSGEKTAEGVLRGGAIG